VRLVLVTQVLDGQDAVLGFVVRWVQGLARHCERVRVIALEVGDVSDLPQNVDVRTIGRKGRVRRYFRYRRALREAFGRDGFGALLTHMVPRYSTLAGGIAKSFGVRHCLWYTHKGVDERLKRAVDVVDKVFTASPESMRVETPKKHVTGHGIDLAHFDLAEVPPADPPRLLSVGRLTRAKDPLTAIEALRLLVDRGHDLHLDWIGGVLAPGDAEHLAVVQTRIRELDLRARVRLHGAQPYREMPRIYAKATALVSTSLTGSVDKVVLEAMAARRTVITCNESFPPILAELGTIAETLAFPPGDPEALAQRVETLLALSPAEREALGERLRGIVARDHEVDRLMGRLVYEMGSDD
jgi:glycosyltransferase involved in cell wall biosynthesis